MMRLSTVSWEEATELLRAEYPLIVFIIPIDYSM